MIASLIPLATAMVEEAAQPRFRDQLATDGIRHVPVVL
jgi:hypothetical protein